MCNEINASQAANQTHIDKCASKGGSVVESESNSSSSSGSLIKWIKVSSFFAFLTTYSHFFGFAFLKGQLERMGFYSSDVDLMVNESLHLTSSGVAEGVKLIITHFLSDEALLRNGAMSALALAIAVAFLIWQPSSKRATLGLISKIKPRFLWVKWLKAPALIVTAGAAGFVLQVLGGLLIMFVFSFIWFGLSLGNHLGRASIESLMNEGLCDPMVTLNAIEWSAEKKDIVMSCASIVDEGEKVFGRIIHRDAKQVYFLTNEASYHLDSQGKVLFKINYKTRARDNKE